MAKMRENKNKRAKATGFDILYVDGKDKSNWAGCCRSRSGRMIFMGWISKSCCARENLTPFPEEWINNEPWLSKTPIPHPASQKWPWGDFEEIVEEKVFDYLGDSEEKPKHHGKLLRGETWKKS
jgi:hypothetical protein